MPIEQHPPKKPNFGLVVALAGAALIALFLLAYVMLRKDHAMPGRYTKHPTTELRPLGTSPRHFC